MRDRALANLRRKLAHWELIHLRQHIEELRAQVDALTIERDAALSRASYAEDYAESWREDALSAIRESGATVGLTIDGHIVAIGAVTECTE